MIDFVLIVILLAMIGGIVFFLIREKKRGVTCVGCPHAKECAAKNGGNGKGPSCGCEGNEHQTKE